MNRSRLQVLAFSLLMMLGICAAPQFAHAQEAKQAADSKHAIYLLSVGNSFSGNASTFIRQIAEADGNKFVYTNAYIGGCPLDKHINLARKYEANPEDPEGRPYPIKDEDGKEIRVSLKELLVKEKWQFITIQQSSINSFKIDTYRPHAQDLVDYIHKYAPQAKIVVHETWAYRADDSLFKDGFTDHVMYQQLHNNYAMIAKEVGAVKILPVGTAFMNALEDPAGKFALPHGFDAKALKYPERPAQENSLHTGYYWETKKGDPKLIYDGHHAGRLGQYLGGAVWYEAFFGDVRGNSFVPKEMTKEQVTFLQNIAHKTVAENVKPKLSESK